MGSTENFFFGGGALYCFHLKTEGRETQHDQSVGKSLSQQISDMKTEAKLAHETYRLVLQLKTCQLWLFAGTYAHSYKAKGN